MNQKTKFYFYFFLITISLTPGVMQAQSFLDQISNTRNLESEDQIQKLREIKSKISETSFYDSLVMIDLEIADAFFNSAISIDSAVNYCDLALSTIEKSNKTFPELYAEAHYLKGFYYRKWDKYEESLAALQAVLNAEGHPYEFHAKVQLGKLYKDRGEFNLAFKHYDDALIIAGDDIEKRIQVFEYISFAYSVMGTKDGAKNSIRWLDSLEYNLPKASKESADGYIQLVKFNKASSYHELGDLDNAIKLVNEAEELLKTPENDPDFYGLILEFQGQLAIESGDFISGIEKLKAGINLFQYSFDLTRGEGLAGTYYSLANAFYQNNQLDSAFHYIDKTIYDRVYGLNNQKRSEEYSFEEMLLLNGEKNYLIQDFMLKAEIIESRDGTSQENINLALDCYYTAEKLLENMSHFHLEEETKVFWRKDAKDIYYNIIRLLIMQNDIEQAFIYSEKSKYVLLEEHLKKSATITSFQENEDVKRFKNLLNNISLTEEKYKNAQLYGLNIDFYRQELLDLREEEENLMINIKNNFPELYNSIFIWSEPNLEELSAILKQNNQQIFSFFLHDSSSFSFNVSPGGIEVREFQPEPILNKKVTKFRSIINKQDLSDAEEFQVESIDIFNTLFGTYELDGKSNVIVPDGILSVLPFDILIEDSVPLPSFRNLKYLLKNYDIRILLNAKSLISEIDQNGKSKFKLSAFALAPNFRNDELSEVRDTVRGQLIELAGAKKEMEVIQNLFGGTIKEGNTSEALFYEILEKNPVILHISTHAFINNEDPELSKLILDRSSSEKYDDLIHLFELKNREITTDLVVLSACNTGNGIMQKGEGISSLGIAFKYAGSPNILNTLWSIPDYSSSILMDLFYKNIKNQMPKKDALAKAKLDFMETQQEKFSHPYYWAGYNYSGNNLALENKSRLISVRLIFYLILIFILGIGIRFYVLSRSKNT